jgi:bacillithiol biosynthesis cysteine-adding enzyme BshC
MLHHLLPFRDTRAFSSFFLDYIEGKPSLRPFYQQAPALENFSWQLDAKADSYAESNRKVLVNTLQHQYKGLAISNSVKQNLEKLSQQNTFTVTTGHQLNIFTGPLYFIYKIVTAISACRRLQEQYPKYNFVPVYWMASEDHDYEEIKSFRLHGKKYTWQTHQHGGVGRFHLKDFPALLQEVPGDIKIFKEAYTQNTNLADAVRHYVNALFGEYGLIVVDADARPLKQLFVQVMEDDIFHHIPKQKVDSTNEHLKQAGYHVQVHARDINLFYLDKQLRARLERTEKGFGVVDSDIHFSAQQLREIIEHEPEKLSPNVILRPVYQEVILPNLAYIGGPAEVVYWLQLKEVFKHFNLPFPILLPRNFALVIDGPTHRKLQKTGLALKDFFEDKNYIFNHWVAQNSVHEITLGRELNAVRELFNNIQSKAQAIDATLVPHVLAQAKKVDDKLFHIEHKLLKAEKKKHLARLGQIEAIKDSLFPNGNLQERTDNFLNFYLQDNQFVAGLCNTFDPFDFRFNVLSYAES